MDIREVFVPAFYRADRILSLFSIVDGDACARLHKELEARICESRVHPLEAAFVLANITGEILIFLDDETQRKLEEDLPTLIDLSRERTEEARFANP